MDIIPSLLDHCFFPHYSYNPISNSFNRDQKKILLTRDLYLFINTYTNKIHLLICFKSIYTLISCYLSIHFQKKVLLLHQHWYIVQKQYNYETWQISDEVQSWKKRTYIKANIKKSVSIFDSSCINSCTIQCMLKNKEVCSCHLSPTIYVQHQTI